MSTDQSDLGAFAVEAAPDGACVRYEVCGRTAPERGRICGSCLDELAAADRVRQEGR